MKEEEYEVSEQENEIFSKSGEVSLSWAHLSLKKLDDEGHYSITVNTMADSHCPKNGRKLNIYGLKLGGEYIVYREPYISDSEIYNKNGIALSLSIIQKGKNYEV